MARSYARKKYKKIRKEFKADMRELLKSNRALCMAILNTYIASKHRFKYKRNKKSYGRYSKRN